MLPNLFARMCSFSDVRFHFEPPHSTRRWDETVPDQGHPYDGKEAANTAKEMTRTATTTLIEIPTVPVGETTVRQDVAPEAVMIMTGTTGKANGSDLKTETTMGSTVGAGAGPAVGIESDIGSEKRRSESMSSRKREERRAEKQQLRDEEDARQVAELSVYSALDNPFHDVNLGQQFKWHKKSEKEKKMGLSVAEARQRDELRRQEAKEELERLNKRRAEREVAQALREEEEAHMQRLVESAQTAEWISKEGDFQLEQERRRAGIRLKEKRAKAIDFLALNLKFASVDEDPDEDGLDLDEVGMEIDFDEPYAIFDQRLVSNEPIDVDYWENLLKSLLVWKAKAKLKSLHEVVVQNRLEQLRKRQRDEAIQAQQELLAGVGGRKGAHSKTWGGDMHAEIVPESNPDDQPSVPEADDSESYRREMSPVPFDISTLPPEERQVEIVDDLEDRRRLFAARRTVTSSRFVPKPSKPQETIDVVAAPSGADLDAEAMYRAEAEKTMDEEEEIFNLEEMIQNPTTYTWEDKYRPRKPRYFNRVHTGYEWNKYNQTHYDTDNPPPKVVQGYKFNIFYPDLIDKAKAPTYRIVKEPGNEDTCLLWFSAGPPYEDIAFRIVNRDWEYSHKRGFRSSFDRGCLSLWFNFRRNFYRK
ncbi:hypothetical protein FRB99_005925 [Tulasnella sp. 403]|nr:hypothetical protein FRB99_005925 [Tulasnella sp. 403]